MREQKDELLDQLQRKTQTEEISLSLHYQTSNFNDHFRTVTCCFQYGDGHVVIAEVWGRKYYCLVYKTKGNSVVKEQFKEHHKVKALSKLTYERQEFLTVLRSERSRL